MTTNAAGSGKFAVVCPLASLAGQLLSATATNATQTTSEFSAVTDPRDPTSTLRISSLEKTVAGPAIYFSSVAGLHYRLETTANPSLRGRWTVGDILGTGGLLRIADPASVGTSQAFYRLVALP